jgi:hypothetical protein
VKQQERWRVLFAPGTPGGGTLATAGGLVFLGNSAYDAGTGEQLLEEPLLGDHPVSWISYMLELLALTPNPGRGGGAPAPAK